MPFALPLLIALCGAAPADDLRCLTVAADQPSPSARVYAVLQKQAYAALDQRQQSFEQLKTADQIRDYQIRMRRLMEQQLGGFPERTPLNATIVGNVAGNGYRVEKIIFESQPNHHLTAVLFLPEGPPPYPGVLVSSGHSRTAKTAAYNQRFGIALARNGMAALCYDPIGQGERSQILTPDGNPRFSGTTQEHFLIGVGSILLGTNTARYRIWDGIRAIDYLASRPDIDPQRIGFTGCSGGGTLTSYVMALDERVACAAPACYLTTFRRLIETIGPQDAEQNIFGQIALGLDQPDYVLMRAPKPTLISSTTGDFFDIQGSWDTFRQAKRIYTRLGHSERIDLVEADGDHGVQPANLVAIVRWMRRWLLQRDDPVELGEITPHAESDLLCTEKGQVLRLPQERSVFDLHMAENEQLTNKRREFWKATPRAEALAAVRKIAGIRPLTEIEKPRTEKAGKVQRETYHIDKLVIFASDGTPLPALTYHPPQPRDDAYLYLHDGGKAADGGPDGPIEKLLDEGFVVVAVDLRGWGETAPEKFDDTLGDWKTYYLSYLLGKSLVGLRTEDILASRQWVAYYQTEKPRAVHLVGVGAAAIPALHAAALEPEAFASVRLKPSLESWSSVLGQPVPSGVLSSTVHGALRTYDLPNLVETLDPAKLTWERPQ